MSTRNKLCGSLFDGSMRVLARSGDSEPCEPKLLAHVGRGRCSAFNDRGDTDGGAAGLSLARPADAQQT